jgi:HEAT repeat protein
MGYGWIPTLKDVELIEGTDMADTRSIVERSVTAECGTGVVIEGLITPANRAALHEIVLNDEESMDRRGRAIYLLGLWRDDETVATIERVVDSLDEDGRIAAASALGRVATPTAVSALERLTADRASDVRRLAINGLGAARTSEAAALLRRVAGSDESDLNRARAAELLA